MGFKGDRRRQAEAAFMAKTLKGEICTRCGATLVTFADLCPAELLDPCPGFLAIDKAKVAFAEQFKSATPRGLQ